MPNFVDNVLCRDLGLLLSFVWFYDTSNWPPKLCTKFEVDTFSHCIKIKGKTPNFGNFPSPGPRPLFLLGGILWWALTNSTSLPILKSLPSVVAEILKGNHKFWELPLPRATLTFFSECNFTMNLGKSKLHTKFEVASFSRCKNIKGKLQNYGELP